MKGLAAKELGIGIIGTGFMGKAHAFAYRAALAAFPDIPAMTEFGSGPSRLLMDVYASTGTIGRALAYPPGVPADRVQVMRDAFQTMVKDPAFIAETRKTNIIVEPMSGEDLTAEIARVMKTPKEQVDAARQIHEDLLKSAK